MILGCMMLKCSVGCWDIVLGFWDVVVVGCFEKQTTNIIKKLSKIVKKCY